ncbi:MAG: hypothetical protein AB1938_30880, partial [Myxococcota bacterium]
MRSSLACWTTEELSAQLEGDLTGALAALRTLTQLERMAPSPALQATLRRFLAHDDERVRWIVLFLIVSVLNVRGRELLAGAKDHAATPAHRKVARSALEQFDAAAGRG